MAVSQLSSLKDELQQLVDAGNDSGICDWADKHEHALLNMFEGESGLRIAHQVLKAPAMKSLPQFQRKILTALPAIYNKVGPHVLETMGLAGQNDFCVWFSEFFKCSGNSDSAFAAETIKACRFGTGHSQQNEMLRRVCSGMLDSVEGNIDFMRCFHAVGVLPALAMYGWLDMVRRLVELGVSPCAGNDEGYSALHMACVANDADMVLYMLSAPAVRSGNAMALRDRLGRTPLAAWASHGSSSLSKQRHAEVLEQMIQLGADINAPMERGRQALGAAVVMGAAELVEALLEAGADCAGQDLDQRSALHCACIREYGKSPQIIGALLKGGADPQLGGLSPAVQIVDTGRSSAFMVDLAQPETAAAQEAGVSQRMLRWQFPKWVPILTSARQGDMGNLAALLAGGADPNAATSNGLAALHVAALHNKPDVVRALLDAGASHTTEGAGTPSPLHFAALSGSGACTQLLLEAGAIPEASAMARGMNPAHWAAAHGQSCVLQLLTSWPAVLVQASNDGSTPLMRAAAGGHNDATQLLLSHGASLSRRDNDGRRACDVAATLDLRAQLTPLPRRFMDGEVVPATGSWLVVQAGSTENATSKFLSAETAVNAILRAGPDVRCCCAFFAVPDPSTTTPSAAGGFGSISLSVFASSDQPCAVKSLHTDGLDAAGIIEKQRELAYEIRVQQSVGAALRLARVFGTTQRAGVISSVSDFIPGVTWDWFCKLPRALVSDTVRLQLAASLIDAILELRQAEVAHRDIHGGNVMVYVNSSGIWLVALVDFGLSFQWSMRADGYSARALSSMHLGLHAPSVLQAPSTDSLQWQQTVDFYGAACLISWLCADVDTPSRDEWSPSKGSFGDTLARTWQQWAQMGEDTSTCCGRLHFVVLQLLARCGVVVTGKPKSQLELPKTCSQGDYITGLKVAAGHEVYDDFYVRSMAWHQAGPRPSCEPTSQELAHLRELLLA